MIAEVEKRVEAWWVKFSEDIFPLLVPRTAWKREQPALEPGSVVLVKYESKFGKDRFRLGRVVDVRKDSDGLVRTAWVGLRSLRRAIREPLDVCRSGLTMTELPVQRLVLVLTPGEQPPELLEGLKDLPPMPGLRREGPQPVGELDLGGGQVQPGRLQPAPVVVEHNPGPEEEILDLPLPQRAPRARGRPRRS